MSLLRNTDVKKHLGRAVPRFNNPVANLPEVEAPAGSPIPATETAARPEVIQPIPEVEAV
jgi:hypothetical protein